jgi:hypothetical protein
MDDRLLPEHLKWWRFLSEHDHCTNEEPPKQTYSIIKMMKDLVHKDPTRYSINSPEELREFDEISKEICGYAVHCICKGQCKKDCTCMMWEVPCGIMCHPAKKECKNSITKSKWA